MENQMEVDMKVRVLALAVALLFSAGISRANEFQVKKFLVPASPECYVSVTFNGTVAELNVMGNGKVEYDDTGRISKIGASEILYDDTGRIEKIGSSVFKYDNAGRIKKIATASILYDDSDRIKRIGVSKISYDDDGRVVGIEPGIAASI